MKVYSVIGFDLENYKPTSFGVFYDISKAKKIKRKLETFRRTIDKLEEDVAKLASICQYGELKMSSVHYDDMNDGFCKFVIKNSFTRKKLYDLLCYGGLDESVFNFSHSSNRESAWYIAKSKDYYTNIKVVEEEIL